MAEREVNGIFAKDMQSQAPLVLQQPTASITETLRYIRDKYPHYPTLRRSICLRKTIERAQEDAREGKSPSTQAGEFVREEMHHVRERKHGAASTK